MINLSRGQFENAIRFEADTGNTKGRQPPPYFKHAQIFIQRDDIDGEQHPQRMDTGGRPDKHTASGIKVLLAKKAEQSRKECIRKNNLCPDRYTLPGICDGNVFHVICR